MVEVISFIVGFLLPVLVTCSGEGNLHLLEDEIATALRACSTPVNKDSTNNNTQRQKRSARYGIQNDNSFSDNARIDGLPQQETNKYAHERRNTSDMTEKTHILNATDYDYDGYGNGKAGESSVQRPSMLNRTKRNEQLLNTPDADQCLSQCVFANLQVVDTRGIPREAELWNKVQSAVTSQQSRAGLHDQLRACFQELQSEAEDDGCSYSNKLERCLMLRFADRKPAKETS